MQNQSQHTKSMLKRLQQHFKVTPQTVFQSNKFKFTLQGLTKFSYFYQWKVFQIMNKDKWRIDSQFYLVYRKQINIFLKNMLQSSVQIISFYAHDPLIVKSIKNIEFINLLKLQLRLNRLDNIEVFNFLNTENLICLDLSINFISQVSCLKRICSKNCLVEINLQFNKIKEFQVLSRTKLSKNMGYLSGKVRKPSNSDPESEYPQIVERYYSQIVEGQNFLFKVQAERISQTSLPINKQFNQVKIEKMLFKKYLGIKINYEEEDDQEDDEEEDEEDDDENEEEDDEEDEDEESEDEQIDQQLPIQQQNQSESPSSSSDYQRYEGQTDDEELQYLRSIKRWNQQ